MSEEKSLAGKAADTIRFLAADAVQKANSGHPGMPMGMADAAVALWTQYLTHNPADPNWANRDRFILSAGHGSMLLYSLLHLTGYDLPMEELKSFRQWESKTPGHPEYGHTVGVETTTGPLGQGISNSVGFAIAEAWLAAKFNKPEFPIVDHYTYVICSDGDLQEGISHEACALAGHLGLGKLIVLYDDNEISIDGPTSLSFSEDVLKRFEAYGWDVNQVEDGQNGDLIASAINAAKAQTEKPSIIACRTTIGYGSPNKSGTAGIHGSPMGEEEIKLTKEALGWPVDEKFLVPGEVREFMDAREAGAAAQSEWEELFAHYETEYPDEAAEFKAAMAGELPDSWEASLPEFGVDEEMATRAASGKVLAKIVPAIPALLGGSADLTGSNKTDVKGTDYLKKGDYDGRYIYFGVREHGMAAILNGLALHGGVIPYGGTFLVFSDYMRGALRLSALMGTHVIYVLTHDSIGLGEDGPTHQPVAHLMALRAIPDLYVFRPADPNETVQAWKSMVQRKGPAVVALTRQGVPTLDPAVAKDADKGAYVVVGSDEDQVILLASGSEVGIAHEAQKLLADKGVKARLVSMPCWELFDEQSEAYQASVLPPEITARVSMEAGVTFGWQKYVGQAGVSIGVDHFGASAPYETIYEEFGLTAEAMMEVALKLVG